MYVKPYVCWDYSTMNKESYLLFMIIYLTCIILRVSNMYACMYVRRFLQSRNPEAFGHSTSRHTFNPESLPILL